MLSQSQRIAIDLRNQGIFFFGQIAKAFHKILMRILHLTCCSRTFSQDKDAAPLELHVIKERSQRFRFWRSHFHVLQYMDSLVLNFLCDQESDRCAPLFSVNAHVDIKFWLWAKNNPPSC